MILGVMEGQQRMWDADKRMLAQPIRCWLMRGNLPSDRTDSSGTPFVIGVIALLG